jgi:hypothetical protein
MSIPEIIPLDVEKLKKIAQTLKIGVAIVEPEEWKVLFENANFFKWFAPTSDADVPLSERLPGFNASCVRARLQEGRAFSFETEAQIGERKIPISVEVRPLPEASQRSRLWLGVMIFRNRSRLNTCLNRIRNWPREMPGSSSVKKSGSNVCC